MDFLRIFYGFSTDFYGAKEKTFAIDYGASDFDLGSQDLDHGSSKFEFGSMGHSLHPVISLVSFLRLIETICKELPSQCSRFSLSF